MRLNIKTRLLFYALGIFLVLNLIGAFTNYMNSRVSDLTGIKDNLNTVWSMTLQLRIAEKNHFQRDTKDLNFFKTGRSEFVRSFESSYDSIGAILTSLKSNELIKDSLQKEGIRTIISQLSVYQTDFYKVSDLLFKRGFKDYGLVGEMREAIHDLEDQITSDKEKVFMLTLRRHEKDYLLRLDPSYRDKLNNTLAEFKEFVVGNTELTYYLTNYQSIFNEIVDLDNEIGYTETTGLYGNLFKQVDKLESSLAALLTVSSNQISEQKNSSLISILGAIVVGILISIVSSIIVIRSIDKSVKSARSVIKKVSKGKLDFKIENKRKDEISDLLNDLRSMADKLKEVIASVVNASNNIMSTGEALQQSSELMSEGASEQSSTSEEISASMEEMTSSIESNASNAFQTKEIASKGVQHMSECENLVGETTEAMNSIIGKISVIEEISRRTNLLALNAAIEAARAGQHGKGFGVVAAEIRRLAERTQIAANEIDSQSESALNISNRSKQLILETQPQIEQTADLVTEISNSSAEQNAGAEQINNAVFGLSGTIQQNATIAEQMAANSKELNDQAGNLLKAISFFDVSAEKKENATARRFMFKKRKKSLSLAS